MDLYTDEVKLFIGKPQRVTANIQVLPTTSLIRTADIRGFTS